MKKILLYGGVLAVAFVGSALLVSASATDGTIDTTFKYAWGDRIGWVNFANTNGNVHVTATGLTGYAWSSNFGWINLHPAQGGVVNDGSGNLSGKAWGQQLGWINFSGVTINSSGVFTGSATVDNGGTIRFDCTNCRVVTDYRSVGVTASPAASNSGGGGNGVPPPTLTLVPYYTPTVPAPAPSLTEKVVAFLKNIFTPSATPPPVIISRVAPPPLQGTWPLISQSSLGSFVFAPLPRDLAFFTQRFPDLKNTFKEVGISGLATLQKLQGVELQLPGLAERVHVPNVTVGDNNIALPPGIPVSEFPVRLKEQIPSEVVFARGGGEKIDIPVGLQITDRGAVEQRAHTVVGSALHLVIKPAAKVSSIKAFLVLKSRNNSGGVALADNAIPADSLTASLLFSAPVFSEIASQVRYLWLEGLGHAFVDNAQASVAATLQPPQVEKRLGLQEFEYTDPDGDGIYTADIQAPLVDGEYEIITVIAYADPALGAKEIRLTTVVDPEGYVYEKNGAKETRIPAAVVSMHIYRSAGDTYELWPANDYSQTNPQTTDVRGTYAFLVPQGRYYISVEAPGYKNYQGAPFEVSEGSAVHLNIELTPQFNLSGELDLKTLLLLAAILLLGYHFYKDRIKEKLIKKSL